MKFAALIIPRGAATLDLVLRQDEVEASGHADAFCAWYAKHRGTKEALALIDLVGTSFDLITLPAGAHLSSHQRTQIDLSIALTRSNPPHALSATHKRLSP